MSVADVLKVAFVLGLASVLLALLRLYQLRAEPKPEPEFVRKLFHIGGGAIGLLVPWLFDSLVPVLTIAAGLSVGFASMRFVPRLRDGVGQVMLAVNRESVGEYCFIAAMCLLFWLSRGDKLLYSVPLLVLACADAFAALIGEQYGKLPLRMRGDRKTYEGAVAFMLTAFLCIHVPVLLSDKTGRLESLLIGVDVSIMIMMAELAAWSGLDNLIIPIWAYMLLKSLIHMDAVELGSHLAFLLTLALLMRFWRNRTTLGDDALFGATLWGYVVWAVGGWRWVLPPLIHLLIYATVTFSAPLNPLHKFRFPVVLANICGSILWLLIYRQTEDPALLLPFAACSAANVAIIALVREKTAVPSMGRRKAISTSVATGMIVSIPSVLLLDGFSVSALLDLAFALITLYLATALFYRTQPELSRFPVDAGRWMRQAIIVSAVSPVALGLHYGSLSSASLSDLADLLESFR